MMIKDYSCLEKSDAKMNKTRAGAGPNFSSFELFQVSFFSPSLRPVVRKVSSSLSSPKKYLSFTRA